MLFSFKFLIILALNLNENTMKTRFIFIATICILSISVSIIACKKSNKTVPVQFVLTDKPTTLDEVNIHIVGMQVKINDVAKGGVTVVALW